MTNEQAKSELMQIYGALSPDKQRAIDTLVKIEPSEDAISREAVLNTLNKHWLNGTVARRIVDELGDSINNLPPVNPQEPKTGHWTHDGSH